MFYVSTTIINSLQNWLGEELNKFMKSPFLEIRDRIFENSVGFVIYDKFPVNKGHCLIIPKREYADYFESTEEEIEGLNKLLFQTKDFIKKKCVDNCSIFALHS